jgi:Leucine-rich repeat (LRR) protein
VLNLEGNQITELPEAVGKLCRLRGINVAKNRLTAFPEALTKCPLLALVDLSGNMIEGFQAFFNPIILDFLVRT